VIDYCGAFQAGKFELGQAVDYRADETNKDDVRLYIRRDNSKDYKGKIEGKKVLDGVRRSSRQALTAEFGV